MRKNTLCCWPATLLLFAATFVQGFGQENRTTNAPPKGTNTTAKIYRDKIEPHWFSGDNKFWYRLNLADDKREFVLVDAVQGTRKPAFDHEQVAKALSDQTKKAVQADHLPFDEIKFSEDGKSVSFSDGTTQWQCDLDSYKLTSLKPDESGKTESKEATPPREERRRRRTFSGTNNKSPDDKWEIVVHGHNLFLRDTKTEKEQPLTYDGNPGNSYARDVERERAVEMQFDLARPETPQPEVRWAPDSKHFVAIRTRPGTQRSVYLIESSPKDQLQPKLDSYPYLKPGDEIPIRKPHLFDVEAGKEIAVSDALFPNPWSISEIRWSPDSSRFTFLHNQRGHQVLRIVAVDTKTGETKAIVDEQSRTFIDYSGKEFSEYVDDSGEIVWASERDGWNHLYLYDAKTGEVKNQITKGEWVVRGVERVDKKKRQIWFRAGGIRPEQDPYYIHYCRINFDGTGLIIMTEGDGTHTAHFSPDNRFFIDTYSRVDLAPINELRRSDDGKLVCKLEEADIKDLLATGWHSPERFVAKGRDGVTDIYGIIHRPKTLDVSKKYPVLESIYAGPHDSFVPKSFSASFTLNKLTQRGFIVVQIDGMGTSNRSKKFHDVCWKNLGDAGFPDRILWMKAAAAKYPYMDLSRVGIYGTSAGGQSALRGLLAHGDFYKAGVSDCGCHDNRMDKIWWNEQWMGWPVGPHYEEQSNVTQAHKLQGKLLLMVGEMDKNVDPASTMQVVNALIKADKDFELLVMPGAGHGVARTPYGWRRLEEFFVRHLIDAKGSQEMAGVQGHGPEQTKQN